MNESDHQKNENMSFSGRIEKFKEQVKEKLKEMHRVKSSKELFVSFNRLQNYEGFQFEINLEEMNYYPGLSFKSGEKVTAKVIKVEAMPTDYNDEIHANGDLIRGVVIFNVEVTDKNGQKNEIHVRFWGESDKIKTYPTHEEYRAKNGISNTKVLFNEKSLKLGLAKAISISSGAAAYRKDREKVSI